MKSAPAHSCVFSSSLSLKKKLSIPEAMRYLAGTSSCGSLGLLPVNQILKYNFWQRGMWLMGQTLGTESFGKHKGAAAVIRFDSPEIHADGAAGEKKHGHGSDLWAPLTSSRKQNPPCIARPARALCFAVMVKLRVCSMQLISLLAITHERCEAAGSNCQGCQGSRASADQDLFSRALKHLKTTGQSRLPFRACALALCMHFLKAAGISLPSPEHS